MKLVSGYIRMHDTVYCQGYTEDQGMQRHANDHTKVAMQTLGYIDRPYPQRFRLYKGEFWGVFHRSFCEYTSWSPDNVARTLSAYFTGYRISDESYFQTLACHAEVKGGETRELYVRCTE